MSARLRRAGHCAANGSRRWLRSAPCGFESLRSTAKTRLPKGTGLVYHLAEEEGFEPSYPGLPDKRFSRPPHSTTLPPLRVG